MRTANGLGMLYILYSISYKRLHKHMTLTTQQRLHNKSNRMSSSISISRTHAGRTTHKHLRNAFKLRLCAEYKHPPPPPPPPCVTGGRVRNTTAEPIRVRVTPAKMCVLKQSESNNIHTARARLCAQTNLISIVQQHYKTREKTAPCARNPFPLYCAVLAATAR